MGGLVCWDATTHGACLAGVDNWRSYDTWDLWPGARGDLSTPALRRAHVEKVFTIQDELGAPSLVPTLALDSAVGTTADRVLEVAEEGRSVNAAAWQSLAARRGFWTSPDLDAYVGSLVQLRAPVWFVTAVRESADYPPDVSDSAEIAGFCRTVHSLALRSRVVVCHSDLFGLPAVAAGADTVGTGWHGKQRVCAPETFLQNDPEQVRRQALWLTYEGLAARLHNTESDILLSQDSARARRLYTGAVVNQNRDARLHHLDVVRSLVASVNSQVGPGARVAHLRAIYETAASEIDGLRARYGARFASGVRPAYVDGLYEGLKQYATAEGVW